MRYEIINWLIQNITSQLPHVFQPKGKNENELDFRHFFYQRSNKIVCVFCSKELNFLSVCSGWNMQVQVGEYSNNLSIDFQIVYFFYLTSLSF